MATKTREYKTLHRHKWIKNTSWIIPQCMNKNRSKDVSNSSLTYFIALCLQTGILFAQKPGTIFLFKLLKVNV